MCFDLANQALQKSSLIRHRACLIVQVRIRDFIEELAVVRLRLVCHLLALLRCHESCDKLQFVVVPGLEFCVVQREPGSLQLAHDVGAILNQRRA